MLRRIALVICLLSPLPSIASSLVGQAPPPPVRLAGTLSTDDPRLRSYHWSLVSAVDRAGNAIVDASSVPARPVVLDFSTGGNLSVSGGCNQLGGNYELQGAVLAVKSMRSTLMACDPLEIMRRDEFMSRFLGDRPTLKLEAGPTPSLVLTDPSGNRLRFEGKAFFPGQ